MHETQTPASGWPVRHPLVLSIGLALIPVVLTAAGQATAQATGATGAAAFLIPAATVAVSAIIGFAIMRGARPSWRAFGIARPRPAIGWWALALAATIVITLVCGGISVPAGTIAGIAALTIAVGINEEVFFRGLILQALRTRGDRFAVIVSSAVFAALHLTALASGVSPLYSALQIVFAALFGVVAAEIAMITGSIWPGVVFHVLTDAAAYLGGDRLTPTTIAGSAATCVILAVTAAVLWRRIPRGTHS